MGAQLLTALLWFHAAAQGQTDCVRGTPKPVLAPLANQSSEQFVVGKSETAVEKWAMNSNVHVVIEQGGCGEFLETFTFSFVGDAHSQHDRRYWLRDASKLLLELPVVSEEKETLNLISKAVARLATGRTNRTAISDTDSVQVKIWTSVGGPVIQVQYTVVL